MEHTLKAWQTNKYPIKVLL